MVWNAYKGLGRAMNVPYSLNMTCYSVNPKLPFEQNCVAEGPFLFDISASTPPSLRFIVMLRRHKRPWPLCRPGVRVGAGKDPTESHDLRHEQPAEFERMYQQMMAWYNGIHVSSVTESGCLPA